MATYGRPGIPTGGLDAAHKARGSPPHTRAIHLMPGAASAVYSKQRTASSVSPATRTAWDKISGGVADASTM